VELRRNRLGRPTQDSEVLSFLDETHSGPTLVLLKDTAKWQELLGDVFDWEVGDNGGFVEIDFETSGFGEKGTDLDEEL
jgi:hypothetical protein